jgi:hypothetical protein
MNTRKLTLAACAVALAFAGVVGSIAVAQQQAGDATKAGAAAPEMKLPPGWTMDDMKAMAEAATPGKMHELLAKEAGAWQGKHQMWMPGGGDPMPGESTTTITPFLDGRFTRIEVSGQMAMGPYTAMGVYGYDNVSKKFVSTWVDNHGTGMTTGEGELSADGKQITWQFSYHCPITKKPAVMRQIETVGSEKTKTLEMFGADPKTGKEFRMMKIEMTKK